MKTPRALLCHSLCWCPWLWCSGFGEVCTNFVPLSLPLNQVLNSVEVFQLSPRVWTSSASPGRCLDRLAHAVTALTKPLSAALEMAMLKRIILISPLFSFVSLPPNRVIFPPNEMGCHCQNSTFDSSVWLCHLVLLNTLCWGWWMIAEPSEKNKGLKSKCFSFVEKTHSNWTKVGFSRKFPNGEIVIMSRGNWKLLLGFSKNIYFCKGSCWNLFHKRPPTEMHEPLSSSLWGSEHV